MKLIWKGRMKNISQLDKGKLPQNAVRFIEPKTLSKFSLAAGLFIIPIIIVITFIIYLKIQIGFIEKWPPFLSGKGALLALVMIIPHELIHASVCPKNANVSFWYSWKHMVAFIHCTDPMSKKRFIILSLLPNLILGIIPLIIWFFLSESNPLNGLLINYSTFIIILGIGDYLNVYNAVKQMPKGSITQMSGFHSYWYYGEKNLQC